MTVSSPLEKLNTSRMSRAILERHIAENTDELERLLTQQHNELEGIKEALQAYIQATEQIIKEMDAPGGMDNAQQS
jgi:hypothetical protein